MSATSKLREIERLRAVAILLVMAFHYDQWHRLLPEVAQKSWSGVDLFFVISGYVVTLSLLRMLPPLEHEASFIARLVRAVPTLRAFYARRFFRILPAALVVALIDREFVAFFPEFFHGGTSQWNTEALCIFGGIYNYVFAFHSEFNLGLYWTLSVEEHFYLLLPMLFVVFRTTNLRYLACSGLAGLSILGRMLLPLENAGVPRDWDKFSSHLRFDTLMAGVALALAADAWRAANVRSATPIIPRGFVRFAIVPALLALIACLPAVTPEPVMHRLGFIALWVMSAILVAYAAKDEGYVLALPGIGRCLEYVGARSYALYLVHMPASWTESLIRIHWHGYAERVAEEPDRAWRQALVQLALAMAMAEVIHRTVEKPFMALGRRLIERSRAGETASQSSQSP